MKTKLVLAASLLILTFAACKKSNDTPDTKEILKAFNSGVLFNTWIINDEDDNKQTITRNTEMFFYKFDPHLTIKKDNTYSFIYKNYFNKSYTETGTWTYDKADMLELKGKPLTVQLQPKEFAKEMTFDYSFQIISLSEEDLVINRIITRTTSTGTEGTSGSPTETVNEKLFLEDND